MLHELEYHLTVNIFLKKTKSLKRRLLEENTQRIPKKIAVLGGSTTMILSGSGAVFAESGNCTDLL